MESSQPTEEWKKMIVVQEHLDLSGKLQRDSGGEITWDWEHGLGNSTGYMLWEKGTSGAPHHHKDLVG